MKKNILTVISIFGILLLMGCSNDPNLVTVSSSGAATGESVSVDVSEAAEGTTVTLTASLNSGRQVTLSAAGVTISPSTITRNGGKATFTMPAAAVVEVTAVFSDIPAATCEVTVSSIGAATGESVSADVSEAAEGTTVTLTASLNSGRQVILSASSVTISPSTITSDGGKATFTMPAAAVDVAAMFSDIITYEVTVSSIGAATGESVSVDVSEAAEGTTVTLTASLNSGRQVTLSAAGVTISPSTISSNGGKATFTMPAAAVEVTAMFSEIIPYEVTVSSIGAATGESVSADVSEVAAGATVTLTAALNSRRQVTLSALGVTFNPSTISSNHGTATFIMPATDVEVTATFSDTYTVKVSSIGAATGESVSADVSEVAAGATVTLTAALNSRRQVTLSALGVTFNPSTISSNNGTATFTMPASAVEVAATFSDIPPGANAISITSSGAKSGESVTADVSVAAEDATVTLTAALGESRQVALSADGVTISPSNISSNGGKATFKMPAEAVNITAIFSDILYSVTVSLSGAKEDESIDIVNKAAAGATVTLTASLNSGRQVILSAASVSISPSTISSDGGKATFIMPATDVEVTATFSDTYAVTVSLSDEGIGESVSANVSEAAEGATVTLTAYLNSDRQVDLSASGVTFSPSTISNNGGKATFTMPAKAVNITANFSNAIGFKEIETVGSESLTMIYANDSTRISFPTEINDSGAATLTTRFWMAETEVTNAVMAEVLQWAYDNGRFSATVSDSNGLDATTAKHGGQQLLDLDDSNCRVEYNGSVSFTAESGYENKPVTNVTWYGAVMFCNWLTEMRDGHTDNLVYTNIDTSWVDNETIENISKNGYRLPSADEWEYAARYLGTTAPSTGGKLDTERKCGNDKLAWTDGYYWTPGNYLSGSYTYYNDESDVNPNNGVVDNKDANDKVAVYNQYYIGGTLKSKGKTDEAVVKSLGVGSANALGIYDMSGNVIEWCFTKSDSYRVGRGGSWNFGSNALRVGFCLTYYPHSKYSNMGFRPCRTAD